MECPFPFINSWQTKTAKHEENKSGLRAVSKSDWGGKMSHTR